jgi:hypothetical protein
VPTGHCNPPNPPRRARRAGRRQAALLTCAMALLTPLACSMHRVQQTVTVHSLETAPNVQPRETRRAIVAENTSLYDLCSPLGGRLGLIQVRSARDWSRLIQVVPQLGPCPDFSRGMIVGLASWTGLPVDGEWPICLESVRLHHGAGLVAARVHSGSYLPDGTTYVETAFVENLDAVLILDVNGVRFYPE